MFLAFWLVISISVISSYTLLPYMETDCANLLLKNLNGKLGFEVFERMKRNLIKQIFHSRLLGMSLFVCLFVCLFICLFGAFYNKKNNC